MILEGSLEDISVPDLIQLLHISRTSGNLKLSGKDGGEAQIMFREGAIVGATHPMVNMNTGFVLLEMGVVSKSQLLKAAHLQKKAGEDRKPFIATLIDMGYLNRETGWKALERLVEETIVEVVGWTEGEFAFSTSDMAAFDDYGHVPAQLMTEHSLDTQRLLMDAIRIIDEQKARKGRGSSSGKGGAGPPDSEDRFSDDEHQGDWFSKEEEEAVFAKLDQWIVETVVSEKVDAKKAVCICRDPSVKKTLRRICPEKNISVYDSKDPNRDFAAVLRELETGKYSLIIVEIELGGSDDERLTSEYLGFLKTVGRLFPGIYSIVLGDGKMSSFYKFYSLGACAVLPKPNKTNGKDRYLEEVQYFAMTLAICIKDVFSQKSDLVNQIYTGRNQVASLKKRVLELRTDNSSKEIALTILKYVAEFMERCVIFLVRKGDLLAIGELGTEDKRQIVTGQIMKIAMGPADEESLRELVLEGKPYTGSTDKVFFGSELYKRIGKPKIRECALVPLSIKGKTIAVIYGDFGSQSAGPLQSDALQILSINAGLALELELTRRKIKKKKQTLTICERKAIRRKEPTLALPLALPKEVET